MGPMKIDGKDVSTLTLREMLDVIDEYLSTGNNGWGLWSVLTALRGPDDESWDKKVTTTAVIRLRAFPKSLGKYGVVSEDCGVSAAYRHDHPNNADHFAAHAGIAFSALGMDWHKSNKRKFGKTKAGRKTR
ncbi:MAG: hypothetical protein A2W26_02285 [Acidobacteria bacterium RBG_16_64_8]|nr:MAG: hypothetical protein A2W26_02285 [Acidobacteria bacterium RBG_16_64_8]